MGLLANTKFIKAAFLLVISCNVIVDVAHKVLLQNVAFKIFDSSQQVIWISIINGLIILPFLLLFSLSGHISDRYNKKNVLIYGACSSFALSVLMVVAYASGDFIFAMGVLLVLAIQSAIYSPAKFGLIIDIYGKENLVKGNSLVQTFSMIAILFSIASASYMFESFYTTNLLATLKTKEEFLLAILPLTYFVLPAALIELLVSVLVLKNIKTSSDNLNVVFDKTAFLQGKLLKSNINNITSNSIIWLSVLGLSVFWAISQGLLVTFPSYVKEYLHETNIFVINGIIAASGIGIALGSFVYSRISKNYIELGAIPFATLGMLILLYLCVSLDNLAFIALAFLGFGFFGGLFVVPLNSLIQFNSSKEKLGVVLAGNNWFQALFMVAVLCFATFASIYSLSPLRIIYVFMAIIMAMSLYTLYKLPQSFMLLFLKFIVGIKYKLEIRGLKNIPPKGGVLLLGNHVSWIDWAIILISMPRNIQFVMDKTIYSKWYINWLVKLFNAIPISNKNSITIIAEALDKGAVVVLFPEGEITRNGHLGEFKKGFELILSFCKTDVKVNAFYIRGLWESMFSRANKEFKSSYNSGMVSVSFSHPIDKNTIDAVSLKQAVIDLSTSAWSHYVHSLPTLSESIFDRLKEYKKQKIFADSTGVSLTSAKFLTASVLFKSLLKKMVKDENLGLVLPASAAGALINAAVLFMGKPLINLNYTSEINSIKLAIKQANIKYLVTSRKFISKLKTKNIDILESLTEIEVIYLEDLKPKISKSKALITFLMIKLLPSFVLKKLYLKQVAKEDTAVILFSSGSEGTPKGVELTHNNVLGNIKQISTILNVNRDDCILGSLPLFHAFGITVTTLLPLVEGVFCVAQPDPTDGFGVGKLVFKHKATIMFGTSIFFRLYARNPKLNPLIFQSLRLVVAGAEKLREDVRVAFKNKFGKNVYEGYGTTETSPVVSCNLPDFLNDEYQIQVGNKINTVGMPIPGTTLKILDPETLGELEVGEEGMVAVRAIQVMKGYLDNQAKTDEVIKTINNQKYYLTGDKGRLDTDGFLTIVDRYSRFAKLGGEMISLGLIEDKISNLLKNMDAEVDFVITSIENDKKGEKVILLVTEISLDKLKSFKTAIRSTFDNKLMIPNEIFVVEAIPRLGSGKKDFKAIKNLACSL